MFQMYDWKLQPPISIKQTPLGPKSIQLEEVLASISAFCEGMWLVSHWWEKGINQTPKMARSLAQSGWKCLWSQSNLKPRSPMSFFSIKQSKIWVQDRLLRPWGSAPLKGVPAWAKVEKCLWPLSNLKPCTMSLTSALNRVKSGYMIS